MALAAGNDDELRPSVYGQTLSAPLVTANADWDMDRIEGETIEQLKWSAQEAFPEPTIQVPA